MRVAGVEGGEPAPDGRARSGARAPGSAKGSREGEPLIRYTALPLTHCSLLIPHVPGPELPPPSRLPSLLLPRPPPPLPPPAPTMTASPSWARCVSGVRPRRLAGRPRARSAGRVQESRPPSPRGVTSVCNERPSYSSRPLRQKRRGGVGGVRAEEPRGRK